MTPRPASRREHQRFCEIEGWQEVRNSRGKQTQHHITYELILSDGSIFRTRISRPANTEQYGKGIWSHILDDQIHVTEAEFWESVDSKIPPQRTSSSVSSEAVRLPAQIAYQLVHQMNLTYDEITALSLEEAVKLLNEHWAEPPK